MTRTLQLDGRRAAFDESGLATAPAILLIHGAGHDRGVWQAVTAGLAAAGRRVIVPDLPGHGDSAGEAAGAVDTMAAWVLAFADAAGLERFELAGHSMGSLIALAAAAAAPARIIRLHLLGSLAPMPVAPFLLDAARSDPAQAHALINKFSFAPAEVLGEERRRALEAGNRARMERNAAALEAALELVRKTAQTPALTADAGRGLIEILSRYTQTFLLLQRYDEGLLEAPAGTPG